MVSVSKPARRAIVAMGRAKRSPQTPRMKQHSSSTLFSVAGLRCVELSDADVPALQRFFDANPAYFHSVNGHGPGSDEASHELHDAPPSGLPFRKQWIVGFIDEDANFRAMANMLADFLAVGVFHIGLFIVASELHGSGRSMTIYEALERWIQQSGAMWIRLGVVKGNAKAERFWSKAGYLEVRERAGIAMGARVNTVRVLVKSLTAESALGAYLERVARDRPDSP